MRKNKEIVGISEQGRSVKRTKTALRNSLVELLKTRSILRISVKEICESANVGRSTFYAHYNDQYDLFGQIEDEIFTYYNNMLKKYDVKRTKLEAVQVFEEMLTHIADNSNIIKVMLGENGDTVFQKKLLSLFIMNKQVMKYFTENQQDNEKKAYYSVFLINGLNGMIQHWLKNNMAMPVKQLAGMMLKCIEQQIQFVNSPK
jgi:AcrR family transcriptional regulator